jgi:hypothetical protein
MGAGASKSRRGAPQQAPKPLHVNQQDDCANKPTSACPEKHASVEDVKSLATIHADSMPSVSPNFQCIHSPTLVEVQASTSPRFAVLNGGPRCQTTMSPKMARPGTFAHFRGDVVSSPIASVKGSSKWLLKRASADDFTDNGGPKDKAAAGAYCLCAHLLITMCRCSRHY